MKLSLFAVAFSDKQSAAKGVELLKQMHEESVIKLAAYAIASKDSRGTLEIEESQTPGARGAAIGGVIGGLAGLLGGPAVAALGAAAGALSGGWFDLNRVEERNNFAEWVSAQITAGRFALLAEVVDLDPAAKSEVAKQISDLGGSVLG